jgi:murein endopeptidase
VGGVAMKAKNACLRIRPSAARKRAIYGTAEIVGALEQAACGVEHTWPESRLFAGDLSVETGGDLKGHASHNSGRDADLAFYMRDAAGRPADASRMLPIGPNGKARWGGELRFDVGRNWALVEALLKNPRIQVQYLFVAHHIRRMLLDHARKTDTSPDVLRHAQAVLRQPRDSSIHEEHFHLRIYCGLHERLEGCVDYGPVHPWVDTFSEALTARVAEVLPFLRQGGAEEIEFAIVRIVRLRVAAAAEHLDPLKDHKNSRVRALATDAVAFLRGERTPPSWAHLTQEDPGE